MSGTVCSPLAAGLRGISIASIPMRALTCSCSVHRTPFQPQDNSTGTTPWEYDTREKLTHMLIWTIQDRYSALTLGRCCSLRGGLASNSRLPLRVLSFPDTRGRAILPSSITSLRETVFLTGG